VSLIHHSLRGSPFLVKESNQGEVKRVEDIRLLEGKGEFVDDAKVPNLAYMGLVRSTYAHAKIVRIDFSKARENPDFIDGITGEDIKDSTAPITVVPGVKETKRKQLAIGKVRYVGEPVAAFLSKTRYSIEDIIESIEVEYNPLAVVTSIEDSKKAEVKLYEDWPDNLFLRMGAKRGDASSAISASRTSVKARIGIKRQSGAPIEPRSYLAIYDKNNDRFDVGASAQRPFGIKNYICAELKVPPEKVHVVVKDVGGGFGTKGAQSYPEPILACIFSKKTGYAVKSTLTRSEEQLEDAAGRDQYCEIEIGCDDDAKITGLRAKLEAGVGVSGTLSISVNRTQSLLPEVYKIPNLEIESYCYVTDKAPLGPVRGAGRPEAAFFTERAVDILARKLSMDPVELRRRNLLKADEFPYDNGADAKYDSGNFHLLLEELEPAVARMRNWRDKINEEQNNLIAGVGICMEIEDTGAQFKESAKISIREEGIVVVATGSSPHGQGIETSFAQLCAKELNVPLMDIRVEYGDTSLLPFGIGTFGSRSMSIGGSAVVEVSRKVKSEIISRAAKLVGLDPGSLQIDDGKIVKIENGSGQSLKTVLMGLGSLVQKSGPIQVYSEFTLKGVPYASGAHACSLTVDRETGKVRIENYVAVDDCGVIINSMIVDGQLHGGIVHGLGGALLEEMVYDEDGQLTTSNFLDYSIPESVDVPRNMNIIHVETPSPLTLNGAKGVGESGTIAAYPCIFNALNDALAQAGVTTELCVSPVSSEEIVNVLKTAVTER
jgi:aerobic carbon-monoxide dehydrogenase large subunit